MDLILDILIPQKDIAKLSVEELFVEWGGEIFSQDPKKFKYKTSLFFQEHINIKYYEKILESKLTHDFIALTLQGECLYNLEIMVNSSKNCTKEDSELISFIYELYKVIDNFYIILLLNEDQIDEQYNIGNADDATKIFINSLNWETPKGIIISKSI